jgi:methionyl aminopeptidase
MMKMDPRAVSVALKSSSEINKLRAAGKMAAQLLRFVQSFVKPGVTTEDLDRLCADWAKQRGAVHAPLGYHGYPKHLHQRGGLPRHPQQAPHPPRR